MLRKRIICTLLLAVTAFLGFTAAAEPGDPEHAGTVGTVLCVDRLATNTNRETKRIAESSENTVPACFVYYGDYQASIDIDGELLAGSLPVRQLKMVVGWLALHEEEAYAAWNKAVRGEAFDKIAPLS